MTQNTLSKEYVIFLRFLKVPNSTQTKQQSYINFVFYFVIIYSRDSLDNAVHIPVREDTSNSAPIPELQKFAALT